MLKKTSRQKQPPRSGDSYRSRSSPSGHQRHGKNRALESSPGPSANPYYQETEQTAPESDAASTDTTVTLQMRPHIAPSSSSSRLPLPELTPPGRHLAREATLWALEDLEREVVLDTESRQSSSSGYSRPLQHPALVSSRQQVTDEERDLTEFSLDIEIHETSSSSMLSRLPYHPPTPPRVSQSRFVPPLTVTGQEAPTRPQSILRDSSRSSSRSRSRERKRNVSINDVVDERILSPRADGPIISHSYPTKTPRKKVPKSSASSLGYASGSSHQYPPAVAPRRSSSGAASMNPSSYVTLPGVVQQQLTPNYVTGMTPAWAYPDSNPMFVRAVGPQGHYMAGITPAAADPGARQRSAPKARHQSRQGWQEQRYGGASSSFSEGHQDTCDCDDWCNAALDVILCNCLGCHSR